MDTRKAHNEISSSIAAAFAPPVYTLLDPLKETCQKFFLCKSLPKSIERETFPTQRQKEMARCCLSCFELNHMVITICQRPDVRWCSVSLNGIHTHSSINEVAVLLSVLQEVWISNKLNTKPALNSSFSTKNSFKISKLPQTKWLSLNSEPHLGGNYLNLVSMIITFTHPI